MKVTSKPIPPPDEDLPVVEITLELTKKECAILRDLLMDGFDWPPGSNWEHLYRVVNSNSFATAGLQRKYGSPPGAPFVINNGA